MKTKAGKDLGQNDPFSGMFAEWYAGYNTEDEIIKWMELECSIDPTCKDVKMTGHETVAGVPCAIFEVTSSNNLNTRIWTATSNGYVIKIETEYKGETTILEFSEIDFNPTIPDSTFELPADVEVLDTTSLM